MSTNSLAVYGTLQPGEANHWVLKPVPGDWTMGTTCGWIFTIGWGAAEGYLGFVPDSDGQPVTVSVLTSPELDAHLPRIDEFEGDGYRRALVEVMLRNGAQQQAWIYVARTDNEDLDDPRSSRRRRR